jgi:hypothetical protein
VGLEEMGKCWARGDGESVGLEEMKLGCKRKRIYGGRERVETYLSLED